jgi:LysR family glycine cleavage system transcriptional activator
MARRLPPLNQLRAFEAAARHLSFGKAGDELHVTHAAISHQIKALEQNLGQALFHRKTRSVELTNAARALYEDTRTALDLLGDAVGRFDQDKSQAPLRASVAPSFASHWLLKRLSVFHQDNPDIRIEVDITSNVQDLADSGFDFAIRHGDGTWRGLEVHKLFDEQLCAVAAPLFAEAQEPNFMNVLTSNTSLLTAAVRSGEWADWLGALGVTGDVSSRLIVFPTQALALDGAITGLGVALADRRLAKDDIDAGLLVRASGYTHKSGRGFYFVHPKKPVDDKRQNRFFTWLQAELARTDDHT